MGYRSDVRIVTTKKGFEYLEKKSDEIMARKENDELHSLLNDLDIYEESKNDVVYMGWNGLKWYCDYPEVKIIEDTLTKFPEQDISFRFARMGEDATDYEENYYSADDNEDLPYPYLNRDFNDDYIYEQMSIHNDEELEL